MTICGISSTKMVKQEAQKILFFPLVEIGAWKNLNPAIFEWRILNVSMSELDKTVNTDATFSCRENQSKKALDLFS